MSNGQTRFPYILFSSDAEVFDRARKVAVAGVGSGQGFITFQADIDLRKLNDLLGEAGKEFGLIEVNDFTYQNADGQFASALMPLAPISELHQTT